MRDTRFGVGRGEFITLIGRSGSGKTTILNILAVDASDAGTAVMDG